MKKLFLLATLLFSLVILSACSPSEPVSETATDTPATSEVTTPVAEETTSPIPFADVNKGIMDAKKEYKLFKFMEGEGSCMEMGFPTNLVYAASNMIKTEDEKYVEDMTTVDFTGRIRFDELPLSTGKVACEAKTAKGVTTAQVVCTTGTGEEKVEVCTASFKLYAVK